MEIKNLTKKYGEKVVFSDFNLSVEEGKITCILGPSGCGKTTLLNAIGGVISYQGEISEVGNISYIFQEPRLIDNLTIAQNLDIVLRKVLKDKKIRKEKVLNALEKLQLSDYAEKYPKSLSGGMEQRVSLGRAFVYPAKVLLMDEPFKGLDVSLKKKIIELFLQLYSENNKTVLFVTHDLDEALTLANRILVLDEKGKIKFDKKFGSDIFCRTDEEKTAFYKEIYRVL